MGRGNLNAAWAGAFLDELARCGIGEICVAPGSRSTPLVLAAARDGRFRLFSIVDERSAGFFALGLGKGSGRPAAVITTSGTAGANLFPAVIEASQGDVPLLVLTADRPHRLRDTDGNQAMDQLRLFGTFPRAFFEVELPRGEELAFRHLRSLAVRAVSLSLGPPRGPVHLNFPFEKPLEPVLDGPFSQGSMEKGESSGLLGRCGRSGQRPFTRVAPRSTGVPDEELARVAAVIDGAERGVIVAGPVSDPQAVGPAILAFGSATGFPVLADPLSGCRFSKASGAKVVAGYDLFLRSESTRRALAPDLVLRFGGSPTSTALLGYVADFAEVPQIVVDEGHRWKDHLTSAHVYLRASPRSLLERLAPEVSRVSDPRWRGLWSEAEARTVDILEGLPPGELLEGEILSAVASGLPDGANLMVASSMPIRDLDAFGRPREKTINVFGNRGVSGIDGLVSTTVGIASAAEAPSRPTVGVLGDLAFFHDMNGLMTVKSHSSPVVFVVVNNDGGGIFHTLPVRDHEPAFSRLFATPHGLDFGDVAGLFDIPYSRASSLSDFERLFAEALNAGGPYILEIGTRRSETHERRRQVVAEVISAVEEWAAGRGTSGQKGEG